MMNAIHTRPLQALLKLFPYSMMNLQLQQNLDCLQIIDSNRERKEVHYNRCMHLLLPKKRVMQSQWHEQ